MSNGAYTMPPQATVEKVVANNFAMSAQGVGSAAGRLYGNLAARSANIATQARIQQMIHQAAPKALCDISSANVLAAATKGVGGVSATKGGSAKLGSNMLVSWSRWTNALVKARLKNDQVSCYLGSGKINEIRAWALKSAGGWMGAPQAFDVAVAVSEQIALKAGRADARLGARYQATLAITAMAEM